MNRVFSDEETKTSCFKGSEWVYMDTFLLIFLEDLLKNGGVAQRVVMSCI